MSEPMQVLVRTATDALREAGRPLRERGWPCELFVDRVPERDTYAVSLRIELPSMRIPIEAQLSTEDGGKPPKEKEPSA